MQLNASDVSGQLMRLVRLIGAVKSQTRAPHGIEWSAYAVLFHLVSEGPQRVKDLAERLHADPSTVSRQASALVDLGLIVRDADPADGRAALLTAAASGHALYEAMRSQRAQQFELVLADWSVADKHALAKLLARLNTDLESHVKQLCQATLPDVGPSQPPPSQERT